MSKPTTFEAFWLLLVEHDIWYDQMKMRFNRKDLKGVANECFIFLLASKERWDTQDYKDFRRCYQSFLSKSPDKVDRTQPAYVAPVPTHDKPILTGEERQEYIKKWLESVRNIEQQTSLVPKLSYKQIADEGDWLPRKEKPWPYASKDYLIEREIHLEYIRNNYNPITSNPNIDWKPEAEWVRDNEKEIKEWIKKSFR